MAFLVASAPAREAAAQDGVIAYVVPEGATGNQNFGGALGMDFDVDLDIEITRLGVFDSGSDGLMLPLVARIYDRDSFEELAFVEFSPEDPGELIGGSRFKDLAEPLELSAGFRCSIVAEGYGATELLANGGAIPIVWSTDDGNCAITFTGSGRYGDAGFFPGTPDGGPVNRYAAGTFIFEALEEAAPRAGTAVVVPELTFGNQDFAGSLGIDFRAEVDLEITDLGCFDSGSDGLASTIEVRLYDSASRTVVASATFTPEEPGEPDGGSNFSELDPPLVVPAGFLGTIVADGYTADELVANNLPELSYDRGGCAVRFLGRRYGDAGAFPANPDGSRIYGAGTFRYAPSDTPPVLPEPPTNLTASAGDGEVSLEWSAPAAGPAVAGYAVFQTLPAPTTLLTPEGVTETSLTLTGLPNGVEQCFEVRSIPAAGGLQSAPSNSACATPETAREPIELFISHPVPEGTPGNQNAAVVLGQAFDVHVDIGVTRLGVFDAGSDGLGATITAKLWNRDTQSEVASLTFTPEEPGELVGGSRFKDLPSTVVLPAGFRGIISAEGYGDLEFNGNQNLGALPLTVDNGGCAVSYGSASTGAFGTFPGGFDRTFASAPYGAGAFVFGPFDPIAGEPQGGIAYQVPEGTVGSQNFGGLLGLHFNVHEDIQITSLGVFDSAADGLFGTIYCRIHDRRTGEALVELEFTPEEPGDLVGGYRLLELDESLGLPAGFEGTVVGEGFSDLDLNGNIGTGAIDGQVTDDGGCLIQFVGGGSYGTDPRGFPATNDGGPAFRYLAGNFEFEKSDVPVVLPPGAPTNLAAESLDDGIRLSWSPPASETPAATYRITRFEIGAVDGEDIAEVAETEYVDDVAAGETYCYQVTSIATGDVAGGATTIACATSGARVDGRFIAYNVPAGTAGTQAVDEAFGLDFDVQLDITVTRLGVFDDGTDGLSRPLFVTLWDRELEDPLETIEFEEDDPRAVLIGGSWFLDLDEPLELPAGFQGSIVVEGYGDGELAGIGAPMDADPGPCALWFVGSRRDIAGGFFPLAETPPTEPFAAGTFEYTVDEELPPGRGGIAYVNPELTVGNQAFGGALGMDFAVGSASGVRVTRLGVFDDSSDGLNLTITAQLFDRSTQEELASLVFTAAEPGELVDGSRFKDLDEALVLPPGFQGTMVAYGYGDGEQNGNQGGTRLGLLTDDSGCLIRFVGSGRYGTVPGEFPPTLDGGPANRYAAGTFEYEPADFVPEDGFVRGDSDASGQVNLTDGVVILLWNFQGGAAPACFDAADTDDSGSINLTDPIIIFQWLFLGGMDPASPTPSTASYPASDCGPDPTDDELDCGVPPVACAG